MTEILSLKTFVNERLTSAAEDIFGMFEKTINEYHAEVSRLNEELRNQRRQLETVLHPNKPLHRADPQQVIINDAERKYCHEQQQCELDWRTNVIEVMDEPAPQQIKEEEELHRTSQKEERNHGLESDSRECVLTQTFDKQSQFSNTYLTRSMKNMTAEPPHKLSNQKEGKHVVQKQACKMNSIEASHPKSPDESQPVYSCKVCGNTFHYKGNLVRHVRLHTKDAECRCGVCGDSYLEATELKVHLRTHKSFQCTVCGKILVNGSSLKVHMRTHTAEKPHCCKVCGRGFKQMGHLIVHTRTHTREKPHCCNICNRGFNQMVHLSVHMRTHTGEKPFSCHVCGKGFVSRGNLVQHIRVHSGDKPFICNDCGKTFTKRTSLNYHMRIHIEEKTFCCHICGQDICTSEDLEKHMLIHINTC